MGILEAIFIGIGSGVISAATTIAVIKNDLRHVWKAIDRHDQTHGELWKAVHRNDNLVQRTP